MPCESILVGALVSRVSRETRSCALVRVSLVARVPQPQSHTQNKKQNSTHNNNDKREVGMKKKSEQGDRALDENAELTAWTPRELLSDNPASWSVVTGETPETLLDHWSKCERKPVIAFYQARRNSPWRAFSNFYQEEGHDFHFCLPLQLLDIAGTTTAERSRFAPTVRCHFSEKAIMLCKAAVMGDAESYASIAVAKKPAKAKALGRRVTPWHEERWRSVVCGVALAVLMQKFGQTKALRNVLLHTGDRLICEAVVSDRNWGIGIGLDEPKLCENPALWEGSNILGWALMQVRDILRVKHDISETSQSKIWQGQPKH